MPIEDNYKVIAPDSKEYPPLPPDVYQCQILDIELRTTKKYMSNENQEQFCFKLKVIDDKFPNNLVWVFTSTKWFNGGKNLSPSKLFELFKAVYAFYSSETDLTNVPAEEITGAKVNELIGKQVRVTVQTTANGKNKVTSFMPIKKELPLPKQE